MSDYTISSAAPFVLFGSTIGGATDFKIQSNAGEMHFAVGNPGWPSALNFVSNQARFQRGLVIEELSGESQMLLKGASDWRLRSTSCLLEFDVYYASSWQTVIAFSHQAAAADQIILHPDLVLARSGTLVIDQACSTEGYIAEFQKRCGGTLSVGVEKDGTLVCTDTIGVRTLHTTSAPGGGSLGDVVIYTDTSTYTSYLRVKTSAGWCGIELDETP
jgi:hypothetical protein